MGKGRLGVETRAKARKSQRSAVTNVGERASGGKDRLRWSGQRGLHANGAVEGPGVHPYCMAGQYDALSTC